MSTRPLRTRLTDEDTANARYAICRNCGVDVDDDGRDVDGGLTIPWSDEGAAGTPIELAAASRLRVTFDAKTATGWIKQMLDAGMAPAAEVASLPWMPSPPIGRDPGIEARAAMLPEVELATGALTLGRTDLVLPAPGMDVVLGREYSSAGIRYGLFGWGWELAGLDRLRPNPDGTVDLYASSGDRFVFGNSTGHPGANTKTLTAWGHPGELKKKADGTWFLLMPDGGYTEFSGDGQPTAMRDRYRLTKSSGSEIRFNWYGDGTLAQISQVNGKYTTDVFPRTISFTYGETGDGQSNGLIEIAEDSTPRKWEYIYDDFGRLSRATIKGIVIDADGNTADHFERYTCLDDDPGTEVASGLEMGARIDTVHDAEDRTTLDVDADGGNPLRVGKSCQGEICYTVETVDSAGTRQCDVTDATGRKTRYVLDDLGRVKELRADPDGENSLTEFLYQSDFGDQLVSRTSLPIGRVIHNTWQASELPPGPRRTWWNLRTVLDTPGPNDPGVEGEISAQTTLYDYKPDTDLVTSVTLLPLERTTTIDRSAETTSSGAKRVITDPENRTTTLFLDSLGRTEEERLFDKYSTSYKYDDLLTGCGEVGEVTPPSSDNLVVTEARTTTVTEYSPFGFPQTITSPGSSTIQPIFIHKPRFNKLGWQLKQSTDGEDDQVAFVYDASGWLSKEIHGSGDLTLTITHEPLASGLEKKTIEEGGADTRTVEYTYGEEGLDPDGLLRSMKTVETGREVVLEYDSRGRVEERRVKIDENSWAVTRYIYERSDDLVTKIVSPIRSDGTANSLSVAYDGFGRQRRATDGIGRAFITDHDEAGRVGETRVEYDGKVWRKETFKYDLTDQLRLQKLVDVDEGTWDRETEYVYDEKTGALKEIYDPEDRKTAIDYDSAGFEKLRTLNDGTTIGTKYWPSGLVAKVTETPSIVGQGNPADYVTSTWYDAFERPREVVRPGNLVSSTFYDALGRAERIIEPGTSSDSPPRLTRVVSSPRGQTVEVIQPGDVRQQYSFDEDGLLVTVSEAGEGDSDCGSTPYGPVASRSEYDLAGRPINTCIGGIAKSTSWEPDGARKTNSVQPLYELAYCTDVTGRILDVVYRYKSSDSACGAEPPVTDPLIPTKVSYEYDPLNRIVRAADNRGFELLRSWTFGGDLESETMIVPPTAGDAPNDLIVNSAATYDRSGQRLTLTYPDGTVVDTSLKDGLGRTTVWTVSVPGKGPEQRWTASYGGMRQIAGGLPAGLASERHYHEMGLESSRAVFAPGAADETRSFRFRLDRERAYTGRFTLQNIQSSVPTRQELNSDLARRFDDWGRSEAVFLVAKDINSHLPDSPPVKASLRQAPTAHSAKVGPNELGDLRGWSSGQQLSDHFVPGTDHRLDTSEHELPVEEGQGDSEILWDFDYDSMGNRKRDNWTKGTLEFTYTHDWANRLVRVESSLDNSVDELFLDPFGRRVLSSINGVTTLRVPWGEQVVAEYVVKHNSENGGFEKALRKRLYWYEGIDRLAGYDLDRDLDGVPDSPYTALTDPQGTVHAVLDDDGEFRDDEMILEPGSVVESYLYWPDGTFQIVGPDLKRPRLKSAAIFWPKVDTQTVILLFSEIVDSGLEGIMELRDGNGELVQVGSWRAWLGGRGRSLDLSEPLTPGEPYQVYVDGMEDLSGNFLEQAYVIDFVAGGTGEDTLIWQEQTTKSGGYAGDVLQIIDGPSELAVVVDTRITDSDVSNDSIIVRRNNTVIPGRVRVFDPSEARKARSLEKSAELPSLPPYPFVVLWEPDDPSTYIAYPDNPLTYDVTVNIGGGQKSIISVTENHVGEGGEVWSDWYDSPLLSATQVGNDRFQHGRPFVVFVPNRVELYDQRARWYEPKSFRFLELDPLGPVDSTNLYQAFGFDGMNASDPMGMNTYFEFYLQEISGLPPDSRRGRDWQQFNQANAEAAERVLSNPRFQGAVQATGGCTSAVVGGMALVAPEPVLTKVAGGAALAYGTDVCIAGFGTLISGELQNTLTNTALRSGYEAAGMDPARAEQWAMWSELAIGVAVDVGAARGLVAGRAGGRVVPGKQAQVQINNRVGNDWDRYVQGTRLKSLDEAGLLDTQVHATLKYDLDIAQTAVRPDYALLNKHNRWAAIGEAKALESRLIEFSEQSRGLVRWAKATETQQLFYYVPWQTKVHPKLMRFAASEGVGIRVVVVK